MKKILVLLGFVGFFGIISMFSSCKTGEGCGLEDKYGAKIDNDGNISSKKGKSNLFSKKQQKRMKK